MQLNKIMHVKIKQRKKITQQVGEQLINVFES